MKYTMPFRHLLNPGHTACAGCGELLAMRHVLEAAGEKTIVVNATGCSEVTTTKFPTSSFKVPWVHANFENAPSVAGGVAAALRASGEDGAVNVIAWGGDGATFDIGLGALSGMMARGENILYVCWDNEAYMNTGVQASGATPLGANTTTTPPGKVSTGSALPKKDLVRVALAHHCPFVATATVGNLLDLQAKVKKALAIKGSKYLQVLVPCVPGWYIDPADTVKVARLAQTSGLYPVLEYTDGVLTAVLKCPRPRPPVEEYLKLQGRYKHLFESEAGAKIRADLQAQAEDNIAKFNL